MPELNIIHFKQKIILNRLQDFINEAQNIVNPDTCVIWIKRIITFIKNELPALKKYQDIVIILSEFITNDGKLTISVPLACGNAAKLLSDLKLTYNFDSGTAFIIDLHPKVLEVCLELFQNGHYAQAIFESIKALNNYVKIKANITDKDLSKAMAKAFDEKNPIIKLNNLGNQSDKDEQEGFKLLFMGAMTGIRNPKAHENIVQHDKNRTLEYLAFISLLFQRAEEGTVTIIENVN